MSDNLSANTNYWKRKIFNKEKVYTLKSSQTILRSITVSANELNYFYRLTNKNVIAQYTVISAIYSFLLRKLINEFDIVLVSSTIQSDSKDVLTPCFFSYSIDLKTSFKEHLQKVKQEIIETLEHTEHSSSIFNKIGIDNLSSLSPYSIQINSDIELECNGILLNVKIKEQGELEIQLSYLEDFVKKSVVDCLMNCFSDFIVNLEKNIDVKLSQYSLLSDNELHQLLIEFNATHVDYPADKTMIDLFEDQLAKAPDNIAIVFESKELSYKALNKKINQLAAVLSLNLKIKKGDVIGVLLPKSDESIISLFAILKLGAIYLPIDTNYPEERINYIIKDSGLAILLTDRSLIDFTLCSIFNINSLDYEKINEVHLPILFSSADLAYIIYTSGSTGDPKGVMVEHKSAVNMALAQIKSFGVNSADRVVWFAAVAFDASISEILMTVYSGASLYIPNTDTVKESKKFAQFIKETQSTVITFPPSYLDLLSLEDIKGLRCVITAGEAANPVRAIEIVQQGVAYYNAYGPTECAVCTTIYKVGLSDANVKNLSIGKPISNAQVYILDADLQILPIGIIGKLYVSGVGLARGYVNKSVLTQEKFILNPFEKGSLMYDTGDLACWLADGNIEFSGRKDHQVKIRGYRIELGEIETTILQYSKEIKQAVVEVKENNQGKVLIGYWVSEKHIDKVILREFLQKKLPEYMIPNFFIELKKLSLTPNGKIDRKALPGISDEDLIRKEYITPRTKVEKDLVRIWQEVLGLEKIGVTDNFFELGGHSLMIGQVINKIHKKSGKTISFKSFFANPTIEGLNRELKEELYSKIEKAPEQSSYPLTPSQERLWMLSQLEGGSLAYNMPAVVKLTGSIDVAKFEESFRLLIARHEILRTYFESYEGVVRQYILPIKKVDFEILKEDFSTFKDQKKMISDYLDTCNKKTFNLEQAPLIRASLIKLDKYSHVFFLSQHHIIGDGWSMQILIKEIIEIYSALLEERAAELPRLNIQYKDYAVWFNTELLQEKYKLSEAYWLEQFSGELPVLTIPSFKPRPVIQTYNGNSITHHFSKEFLEQLKTFSKSIDATLFMTLMAGVNTLLHKYSGQDDIIVGTPIAGRDHPDLEGQIGLYLNTLAIRTKINSGQSFLDIVNSHKEALLGSYEHQNYPFNSLVSKLNLKRDASRSALFDVMVILQNQNQLNNLKQEELVSLKASNYDFENTTSQFDLAFTFTESEVLTFTLAYNTDVYDLQLIERIVQNFENLIEKTIRKFELPIQEIDYLSEEEKKRLLSFNNTQIDYPKDKTIIDLFEDQVLKTPGNLAVIFNGTKLTYDQLDQKANQFAHYLLKSVSLKKGDFISINIERSEYLIIALLGVLKSGFAYVLLDPLLPKERLNFILNDSGSKLLINDEFITKFKNSPTSESNKKPDISIKPEDVVYLMYTSGSTGNPKGAINVYKGFTNTVRWYVEEIKITEIDKIGIISNLSFDLTQKNYFAPLIVGASVFIDFEFHPINTSQFIKENAISIINCAPSLFYGLLEGGEANLVSLKKIILGGESINVSLIKNILRTPGVEIFNSYGPSEASDVSISYQLTEKQEDVIPIGKPIRNTTAFILDVNMKQVPIGTNGQICIGGMGVGLGYLNNEPLTAEKFVHTAEWAKLYKTGDIGRFNLKGEIEFLGRVDNQVKIRGHRVELEEIENKIQGFDKIVKQVCVDVKSINNENVLVAYVVTHELLNKSELRRSLQEKLPQYMIPSYFVELSKLPLTPNGKIDRKALPNISSEDVIRNEYVVPKTETEKSLVEIWQEILALKKIGITDNFFELGGHSLIAVKLIFLIENKFSIKLNVQQVFTNPTIQYLAIIIENYQWSSQTKKNLKKLVI